MNTLLSDPTWNPEEENKRGLPGDKRCVAADLVSQVDTPQRTFQVLVNMTLRDVREHRDGCVHNAGINAHSKQEVNGLITTCKP